MAADYEAAKRAQEEDGLVVLNHAGVELSFDLRVIALALGRVNEVAHASRSTAQELADAFADSEGVISRVINRAASASAAADQVVDQIHGRLLLDHVPSELERRGLKDSVDRREAIISTHPEYLEAQEVARHLKWVVNDLRSKKERVYRAHCIARAILGERDYHRGSSSGGAPTSALGHGQTHASSEPTYGTASFNRR